MHDNDTGADASTQEARHTPGPWVKERFTRRLVNGAWGEISDQGEDTNGGYVIAELYGPDAEANANLIAAAPDLLTALHNCMVFVDLFKGGDEAMQLAVDEAGAAIAKARGRS